MDNIVTIIIVIVLVILVYWMGKYFISHTKRTAESMPDEEYIASKIDRDVKDQDEQVRAVAKTAKEGSGCLKWMAIIIVLMLILDGLVLNSKILDMLLDLFTGAVNK
jgi:hypothetical protein